MIISMASFSKPPFSWYRIPPETSSTSFLVGRSSADVNNSIRYGEAAARTARCAKKSCFPI